LLEAVVVVYPPCSSRAAVGIAEELAPMVRLWYQLTVDHTPNSEGCCQGCTEAGTGELLTPWPCVIRGVAELARDIYFRRMSSDDFN
jgi:hypothetical protein